ncbi:MAG: hypothetical protein GMKNLPBB_02391 [Myxococcota bacterium]|nr:hypothetical protein [Myxococcota bacterium]
MKQNQTGDFHKQMGLALALTLAFAAAARAQQPPVDEAAAPPPPAIALSPASPASAATPSAAAAPREPTKYFSLPVFLAGGVSGSFGDSTCRASRDKYTDFSQLVVDIRNRQKTTIKSYGTAAPVIITGDLGGPGSISRYGLNEMDAGPDLLATAVARMLPTLVGVGNKDLLIRPRAITRFAQALRARKIHYGSANMECDQERKNLCGEEYHSHVLVNYPGINVGFFALQAEDLHEKIDPAYLEGIQFADPAKAGDRTAARLRKMGASLVIAVVHQGNEPGADSNLISLARKLGPDVDAIFTDTLAPDAATYVQARISRPEGPILVVGAPVNYDTWFTLGLMVSKSGPRAILHDVLVTQQKVESDLPRDPQVEKAVQEVRASYCGLYGKNLPNSAVGKPMTRERFLNLLLEVMRTEARAEVAVVNRGVLSSSDVFPVTDALRYDDIFRALPFPNQVVRYRALGSDLRGYWAADKGKESGKRDLLFAGLSERNGALVVNGRPLNDDQTYSITTIDYLARGGDSAFGSVSGYETAGEGKFLRDLVIDYFTVRDQAPFTRVRDEFPDYWNLPHWTFASIVDASYSTVKFSNLAGYRDIRIPPSESTTIEGTLDTSLNMNTRAHGWTNRLVLRYATTITPGVNEEGEEEDILIETSDVIQYDTAYQFRYFRDTLGDGRWQIPVLVAESRIQTEFTEREPFVEGEEVFRQFIINAIGGVLWEFGTIANLRIGAGIDREVFNPDARYRLLLAANARLFRLSQPLFLSSQVYLQSEADYRWKDPGGDDRHEIISITSLGVTLFGPLELFTAFDYFGLRALGPWAEMQDIDEVGRFAHRVDLQAGLRLDLSAWMQTF